VENVLPQCPILAEPIASPQTIRIAAAAMVICMAVAMAERRAR